MKLKSSKDIIKHAPEVAWRRVEDEVVILDLKNSIYYSLSAVGARIWELIGKGTGLEEIVQKVGNEYSAKENTIRRDLKNLLERLRKEKLIVPG